MCRKGRHVFLFWAFLSLAVPTGSWAKLGVDYQMALGNPSGATTDPLIRTNYLVSRSQFVLSYNDDTHQANWVSWSYSLADDGTQARTDAWAVEELLPSGYLRIGTASFGSYGGITFDRGHMCPSADRTTSYNDNAVLFRMSNIIPQASSNNQGLWAQFEDYCRALSSGGSEILLICGPSEFTGNRISNQMSIPGSVWKIAVVIPNATSTTPADQRINTSCRVIAILTPNVNTGLGSWQSYITSVEEIEAVTGFKFFTAVDASVATYLKNVVDTGTGPNQPTVITSFSPASGPAGTTVTMSGYNFGTTPIVQFNGVTAVASVSGGTTITATVPVGAGTGPITVTGTGGTDTSASNFTFATGTEPALSLSTGALTTLASIEGSAGTSQSYTVNGSNLSGNITVTAPTNFELSLNNSSFADTLTITPSSGNVGQTVFVRIKSTASLGSVSGTVTHSGGGATTQSLAVSGTVASNQPLLTLSTPSLTGFSALQGSPSMSKSYTVSGVNLTNGNVNIAAPVGYEISLTNAGVYQTNFVLLPSGGIISNTIYVRLSSSALLGSISGIISNVYSTNVTSINLGVSGNVVTSAVGITNRLLAWEVGNLTGGANNFGPSPFSTVSNNLAVTSAGLTRGVGITTTNTGAGGAWGGNGFDGTAIVADAITRGDFISFSLSSTGSNVLSLVQIPSYNIRRSSSGPTTGQWQYKVGSGSFLNLGSEISWGTTTTSAGNLQNSIDLRPYADLQNIQPATEVTFRLVTYGATGAAGTFYINNISGADDFALDGIISVPLISPVITSTNSAIATNYAAFSYAITASNNPVSYNASGLPSGLAINTSNGLISGNLTGVPGTYTIGLSAINSAGEGTKDLTLTLLKNPGAPTLSSPSNATAYLRSSFSFTVTANPAATAYSFSGLPPGLTNSNALISGTPTTPGTYPVTVTATNSLGSDSQILSLAVVDPVLSLSTNSLSGLSSILGQEGSIQSYTISGSNLTSNVTVTAPAYFTISLDSVNFTNSLSLAPATGSLAAKTVFARLGANAPKGTSSGTITHSGGGALPSNLAVSGNVIQPQLSLSTASLQGFTTRPGVASSSQSYTVSGTELTGGITVLSPVGFEISTDNAAFSDSLLLIPSGGILSAQTLYVRISASASGATLTGSILHEGGDAAPATLSVSGESVQPSLVLSLASLSPFSTGAGSASTSQGYTISGTRLTGPITVTAPPNFEISLNNSAFGGVQTLTNHGTLSAVPIYVRVQSNAPVGSFSGVVSHSGGDATSQNLSVSGTVISTTPAIGLSLSTLSGFATVAGTASSSQSYTVSGANLSNVVTVTAPAGFEVAPDNANFTASLSLSPNGGSLSNVLIYVRLAAAATVGNYSASISHTSGGATSQNLSVSGGVSSPNPVLLLSTSSLSGFNAVAGNSSTVQNYSLSGTALKGAITVSSTTNFEIATTTNSFATTLTLIPSGGILSNTMLYVRSKSSAPAGALTGSVTHSGGTASNQVLTLAGTVLPTGPAFSSPMSGSVYTNSSYSNQVTVGGTNTNATYTFSASGLPAGFSINPTNGTISGTATNVSRTNFFTVTASNSNGVTTGTYRLRTMTLAEQDAIPFNVVVNKFWNNSSSDKIELLVTGQTNGAAPVDMRGMTIKDYNSNMGSDQGGKYVFNDVALWSRVKAGTLIVLSAGTSSVEDLDPSDFVLRVNLGNATFFTPAAGGFDLGNIEMVMIKTADAGSDGVAGGIHLLAVGSTGTQYNNFKGKKMINTTSLNNGTRTMVGAYNNNATLSDFYSSFGAGTSSSLVFGSPNSTGNSNFIATLRAKDQDGPVITVAGVNPLTIAHGSTYTDAGATALDAVNGSRSVTTNNPVNPNVVGTYAVTYTASDATANSTTATRTVNVTDQAPPLLTLVGSTTVQVTYGSSFSDPGAIATDAVDGDLSPYIQVMKPYTLASAGWSAGTYLLSYVVSDAAGNASQALTRTVQVIKATPTISVWPTATAISSGLSLGSSSLSGGSSSVPGTFAFTSASTIPGATGVQGVTFTPSDTVNYNTVTSSVSVTVNPNPLASWAATYGLSGANAGSTADPDGDGWSNALEYAFGLNPTNAGGTLAMLSQESNQVKLTFLQKDTGGITYAVKSATSLSTGFSNSITPQLSTNTNGVPAGYKRYEATLPTTNARGFLKVEATIP
jgi:DNA/RNA endonuclease G (NUC1)